MPEIDIVSDKAARFSNLLRHFGHLKIRTRLTAAFVTIFLSMLVANLIAGWQFRRMTASAQSLDRADRISLAAVVVHFDIDTLRNRLTAVADTQDGPEFASEAGSFRRKFLEDITDAQQLFTSSDAMEQDPAILSILQTLQVTLPTQVGNIMGLAAVNDWAAVRLRLADQVQGLMDLSSLLVERVDREVSHQRAQALESAHRASRQLMLVLPATAVLTMLIAVLLGWYVTLTITEPLSQLYAGAQALARGEFQHEVKVTGGDELAALAEGFNYAARRLRELYDGLHGTQEALRRSGNELHDLIETMPATVWRASPDGSLDFVNQRWQEFTGLPPEDAFGWKWEAVVHPADRANYIVDWRSALAKGEAMESEIRVRRADGEYRWWFVRNVPLRDERGGIAKWYGTAINIDDRKRAEAALRRSESELRDLIENVPAMLFIALPGPANAFASRSWREYSGLSAPETAGSGWQSVVHPQDLERHINNWRACSTTGEPFEDEARIRRASDGAYRWFLIRAAPLRDEQGHILKWYGTLTDIEDRKRAEQALKRSEAYLADAQRLSHVGTWAFITTSKKAAYWSEENFLIWAFDPQQGAPDQDMVLQRVHPEDRERVSQGVQKAIGEKTDHTCEFRLILPDGTIRHIHSVLHPVFNATGEPLQVIGTHVDVTERKQAEEDRERLRRLEADLAHVNRVTTMGELTLSLAHELNQPIAAAITSAHACLRWLERDPPDLPRARAAIIRVDKDATRAGALINRLRGFFEKDATVHRQLVDLNAVAREMIELLRNEANRYSISIRATLAPRLSYVEADRVQLQQVFMNLMLNAIEAMKGSSGELIIESSHGQDGQLLISISDTGAGLPAEKADQIFDAFFTTKPDGAGMGLAISRSIVESHGGHLWATNNTGPGATFHFSLPGKSAAEA